MIKVKYISSVGDASGYSSAARHYIYSLLNTQEIDLSVKAITFEKQKTTHGPKYQEKIVPLINKEIGESIQIVHTTPENFPIHRDPRKYNIGYTVWETDKLPEQWPALCNMMNEIWVPCFPQDTYIYTARGLDKIKNITLQDKVYSHTGSLCKIKKLYKKKYQGHLIQIQSCSTTQSTPEHPYLIGTIKFSFSSHKRIQNVQLCWKQAKDITKSDYLCIPKIIYHSQQQVLNIIDITRKMNYLIKDINGRCIRTYKQKVFNHQAKRELLLDQERNMKVPSSLVLGEDIARLFGYFMADGCQHNKNNTGIDFLFHQKEISYINDVLNICKSVFNILGHTYPNKSKKKDVSVAICNKVIGKLFKWAFNGTKKNKWISEPLFNLLLHSPPHIIKNFLVGYFNGDGHIHPELRCVSGFTISEKFAYQLMVLSSKIDMLPTISSRTIPPTKLVKKECKGITWSYTGRQLEILRDLLSKTNKLSRYVFQRQRTQHFFYDNNFFYVPIRDIKYINIPELDVFNLEVKDDNSYIANGIAVHNCDYNVEVFRKSGVNVPIIKVPHVVEIPDMSLAQSPIVEGKDTFAFYAILQWIARKAPETLLKAYLTEFKPEEPVTLLLKTYRIDTSITEQQLVKADIQKIKASLRLKTFPSIVFFGNLMPYEYVLGLHQRGDCFISAHHAEGWGLTISTAMSIGKPVITTNYGGSLEFTKPDNTYLIRSDITPCSGMIFPNYNGYMNWGDASVSHLKELMRYVYTHREEAKEVGERARQYILENFNPKVIGNLMLERLKYIQSNILGNKKR